MAKQYNIKEFSGMGDEGVYYLEGMSPAKKNGHSILTPSWYVSEWINNDTTGYSNISLIKAIDGAGNIVDGSNSTVINNAIFSINDSGNIFCSSDTNDLGEIHTIPSIGSGAAQLISTQSTDLKVTSLGNLIYTSSNHLGIGYRIIATGGTSTSITATGTDFASLGLGTTGGINKVYNLNTEEEYTITSINGTSSDTINFSAGSGTPAADDVLYAFVDSKWLLNAGNAVYPQMAGQNMTSKWKRQIVLFGENYYILNGNWLAILDVTNAVFNADEKQLPELTNSISIGVNDSKLLVTGISVNEGTMCLYDGVVDGWNSIKKTYRDTQAIIHYSEGWIMLTGSYIYYTNGYTIQKLATIPDGGKYRDTSNVNFNGIEIIDDNILIGCNYNAFTRRKRGLYIYKINQGWTFAPVKDNGRYPTINYSIGSIKLLSNISTGDITNKLCIGYGNNLGNIYDTGSNNRVITTYLELKDKQQISQIKLNTSYRFDSYSNNDSLESVITVSVDDGSRPHFNINQAKDTSTKTTIYVDGVSSSGVIGQEIEILEGLNAGERSFITSITNAGTVNEAWTISPTLSNNFSSTSYIQRYNFVKCDTKTIGIDDLNSTIDFNVPRINTDKLFVEIVMTDGLDLDINSITIK